MSIIIERFKPASKHTNCKQQIFCMFNSDQCIICMFYTCIINVYTTQPHAPSFNQVTWAHELDRYSILNDS